jgi:hypothetical protein
MNSMKWHNGQVDGAKCVFCSKIMTNIHESHNPYPIKDEYEHGRCCETCNANLVIPARILKIEKATRRFKQSKKKRPMFRI